jgi:hypothetical protein
MDIPSTISNRWASSLEMGEADLRNVDVFEHPLRTNARPKAIAVLLAFFIRLSFLTV